LHVVDNPVVRVGAVLTVREIWRFPIKSMGGERVEQVAVSDTGILGDRAWGVRDEATGLILTGRREPRLLMATAAFRDNVPVVHLADGRELTTAAELSDWLDRPVDLVSANATPGTYENPRDVDLEDDWVSWQGPVGSFHDSPQRVSMVSTASLADYEPKRFRINLILDGADDELSETTLIDRDVTIGSVGLHLRRPIDRCIMITRAQPGIGADRGVLKRLVRVRDNLMGVGAQVYRDGTLAIGDVVHPLPE
jgi:uncharacterized protein YcbX